MNESVPWLGLAVALASGLLIGIERERRKGQGSTRAMAGVRTFTVVSLCGALSYLVAWPWLTLAGAVLLAGLILTSYRAEQRAQALSPKAEHDPGITTEMALFVTYLLGVLALQQPALAGAMAVVVAVLLAARSHLHRFSIEILTQQELQDALLLAAAALVVLPQIPNEPLAFLGGVNPRRLWLLAVLMMGLQAVGYVASRLAGPRYGLPLAGLASGFVSSTATVASMGARCRSQGQWLSDCRLAAWSSCLATNVQLVLVMLTIQAQALALFLPLLGFSTLAIVLLVVLGWRRGTLPEADFKPQGRAFSLKSALLFACVLSAFATLATWLAHTWGELGVWSAALFAGFADVHAAAASVLSAASEHDLSNRQLILAILLAYTANTVSKCLVACASGGLRYGVTTSAGLLFIVLAAWLGIIV
jgi:uncharacterized membrane protein (DUF4010 family)